MTDGFGVLADALHRASRAAQAAAAQVHGVDVAAPFTSVSEALPGSATAGSASIAAGAVAQMLQGWVEQATRYAADLEASSTSYRTTDQTGATTLDGAGASRTGPAFPELGGPTR